MKHDEIHHKFLLENDGRRAKTMVVWTIGSVNHEHDFWLPNVSIIEKKSDGQRTEDYWKVKDLLNNPRGGDQISPFMVKSAHSLLTFHALKLQLYPSIRHSFNKSWTVPLEFGASSSDIMTWGLVAQRLGKFGWGMKVGGSRWNLRGFVVFCCCKGFLVENMGGIHFEFHIKLGFRDCSGREKYQIYWRVWAFAITLRVWTCLMHQQNCWVPSYQR